MPALLMFIYGLATYAIFLVTFLYTIAFIGDLPVPKTIDSGPPGPLIDALLCNLALIAVFGVQHSVMARPGFKRAWTRLVPEPIERSTYVLAASAALALLIGLWRPIAQPVFWQVDNAAAVLAIQALFALGWGILVLSTFLIDHFELFGLSQVWHRLLATTPKQQAFRTPLLYRHVRHPLYLGFVIGAWATPVMTLGHLVFAAAMTGYVLIGIFFEERDLVRTFGERYRQYRREVSMLLPWPKARAEKIVRQSTD